jgi:hypothetical protein
MRGRSEGREDCEHEREMQRMRGLVGELALANFAMKKGHILSPRSPGGGVPVARRTLQTQDQGSRLPHRRGEATNAT